MGSGLVINSLSTGGQVYKLKEGVSTEAAHQKGQKDGLDQVYFSDGKNKYVLEGDNLKLGELKQVIKGGMPSVLVKLNGKPTEIKIEKIDDEVSTVKDGFVKNGKIATVSTTAIGVGVPVAAVSGFVALCTMGASSSIPRTIATGGIYLGVAATIAGVAGLLYYTGKSVVQGSTNKPDNSKTESIKQELVNTDNNAKPAGLISVQTKKETAERIATEIIIDTAVDAVLGN